MSSLPHRLRPRLPWVPAVAITAALLAIVVIQVHVQRLGGVGPGRYRLLALVLLWEAIAVAAAAVLRFVRPRRLAAGLVVASLIALPAASLTRASQDSDDQYRYAWDGRLQAAGVDPYRYAPDAPQLQRFRDGWLWPDAATCVTLGKKVDLADPQHACTRINRPDVHTIYPPVAEGYFLLADVLPGPSRDHRLQLDAALLSAALAGLLAFGLRRTGRDPLAVAFYTFTPLAGIDIAGDAHVDVLAAVVGVGAIIIATLRPRLRALAGALAGVAIAVKLYPVLLLPGLLRPDGGRRGTVRLVGAAVAVVFMVYLPHVLAVGPHVLGYLPGYLREERYDAGSRFLLLGLLGLGATATKVLAVLAMVAAIATVATRCVRGGLTPAVGGLAVLAAAFLIATPIEPWYALLLVCMAVLTGRLEWLAVAIASYPLYVAGIIHDNPNFVGRLSYAVAGAFALAVTLTRAWRRSRDGAKANIVRTDRQSGTNSLVPVAETHGGSKLEADF